MDREISSRIRELLLKKQRGIVAIDGMAASGKTTLAAALAREFPQSYVVHMDDFTIPFENRYPGYFDDTLANADVGRFDREVLSPFLCGREARFRPYVCHPDSGFLPPLIIPQDTSLLIVEGAYCLHPALFDRYDLRVLSLIDPALQARRIVKRNGQAQLERFLSQWIPMENRHIDAHGLRSICDLTLFTD